MEKLAGYVYWQLTIDFRLVDVYIQRLLMLYETGNHQNIRSRWIARFLEAQIADGGWVTWLLAMPVGQERVLSISSNGVSAGKLQSNFHSTAQGVLLTTYLMREHGQSVSGSQ